MDIPPIPRQHVNQKIQFSALDFLKQVAQTSTVALVKRVFILSTEQQRALVKSLSSQKAPIDTSLSQQISINIKQPSIAKPIYLAEILVKGRQLNVVSVIPFDQHGKIMLTQDKTGQIRYQSLPDQSIAGRTNTFPVSKNNAIGINPVVEQLKTRLPQQLSLRLISDIAQKFIKGTENQLSETLLPKNILEQLRNISRNFEISPQKINASEIRQLLTRSGFFYESSVKEFSQSLSSVTKNNQNTAIKPSVPTSYLPKMTAQTNLVSAEKTPLGRSNLSANLSKPQASNPLSTDVSPRNKSDSLFTRQDSDSRLDTPASKKIKFTEDVLEQDLKSKLINLLTSLSGLVTRSNKLSTTEQQFVLAILSLVNPGRSTVKTSAHQLIEQLVKVLKSSLAQIDTLQLRQLIRISQEPNTMNNGAFIELPLKIGDVAIPMSLDIAERFVQSKEDLESQNSDKEQTTMQRQWQVFLEFEFGNWGKVSSELVYTFNTVSTKFWVENTATYEIALNKMEDFLGAIKKAGIKLDSIEVLKGSAPGKPMQVHYSLVDIET